MDNFIENINILFNKLIMLLVIVIKSTVISIKMEFKFMWIATITKSSNIFTLHCILSIIINILKIYWLDTNLTLITSLITYHKTIKNINKS
jgi:hypothetical protein